MGTITTHDVQYASNHPKKLANKLNSLGGGSSVDLTAINQKIATLEGKVQTLEGKVATLEAK